MKKCFIIIVAYLKAKTSRMEKRKSYDFKFKQAVVNAEENSNRETGRKFSVDESMVRRWRKTMADVDEGSPKTVQSILL